MGVVVTIGVSQDSIPTRGGTCGRVSGALLASAALAAPFAIATLLAAPPALAACSTTTPADGSTVTCTGTETNQVGTGTELNVTINVLTGASIVRSPAIATAISLDSGNTLNNNGLISARDSFGV